MSRATIFDKNRATNEVNAYVARMLAESSFLMASAALGLSVAVTIAVIVYFVYLKKNDRMENTNTHRRITMQEAEAHVLLTVQEAADYLRVSTRTIRRWADENLLDFVRVGHEYRILRDSLPKFHVQEKNLKES